MAPSTELVWFITGAGSGLGRALADAALTRGDRVVAAARTAAPLSSLAESHPEHARALALDVTAPFAEHERAAAEAVGAWGRVDVVVNNAGTAFTGSVEENGASAFMKQFETNFFGAINVINAFLPYMRERRSGTIVNVGSRSAWKAGIPSIGPYASSKVALRAMTESLATEVAPFGIRCLTVEPGGLRTTWLKYALATVGSASVRERVIADYDAMRARDEDVLRAVDGRQPGDPAEAARVIADVVRGEGCAEGRAWAGWLALGSDSVRDVRARCEETLRVLGEWEEASVSVDH